MDLSVSAKIGGLPVFSWVFDYGPVAALLIVFFTTFGAVWILQELEGIPRSDKRRKYKAFLYGEALCIPAYVFIVVAALQLSPALDGFYTKWGWHFFLLIIGWTASVLLEVGAVRGGQYTRQQEFAPHKLWHTFMFGIVFYWILSTIIPIVIHVFYGGRWVAGVVVLVPILSFVYTNYLDSGKTWRDWTWLRHT